MPEVHWKEYASDLLDWLQYDLTLMSQRRRDHYHHEAHNRNAYSGCLFILVAETLAGASA